MDDDRLNEIEIKLLHQEATTEELRQALDDHHLIIEKLQKELKDLKQKLSGPEDSSEIGPQLQKPPHY